MGLYCHIYVDFPGPRKDLEKLIRELLGDDYERWEDAISAMRNDRPPPPAQPGEPAFVAYPLYVEYEPDEGAARLEQAVMTVARLVRGLKQHGYDAVPACDYEDQIAAELA